MGGGGGWVAPRYVASWTASRAAGVRCGGGALGALGLEEEPALDEAAAAPGVGGTGVEGGGKGAILFRSFLHLDCPTPDVDSAGSRGGISF